MRLDSQRREGLGRLPNPFFAVLNLKLYYILREDIETERRQVVQCICDRDPAQQLLGDFHAVAHFCHSTESRLSTPMFKLFMTNN